MMRLTLPLFALVFVLCDRGAADAADRIKATLYKLPSCSCCDGHADHLRAHGFEVSVVERPDLSPIKQRYGVPSEFEGCHSIEIDGYVVEGHVPAGIIRKLLKERPPIRGIALPGMPEGSPGMSGAKREPFVVYEISEEQAKVFATD